MRADRRATILAVAGEMARVAEYGAMTSRPTRAACERAAGRAPRSVQRAWRWLERQYAVVLQEGTTPQFSPGVLAPDDGNQARLFRLVLPPEPEAVELDDAPPRTTILRFPSACAREAAGRGKPASKRRSGLPTRAGMLRAAEWLRFRSAVLRRISGRMLRSLLRRFWQAGWAVRDTLHGLDAPPDGRPHLHTDDVRDPAGWVKYRMSHWLDADGRPGGSRSQQLAAAASAQRAEQAARRAARAAALKEAGKVDQAVMAGRAREQLAEALRRGGARAVQVTHG